jgi:hypothetical protein
MHSQGGYVGRFSGYTASRCPNRTWMIQLRKKRNLLKNLLLRD